MSSTVSANYGVNFQGVTSQKKGVKTPSESVVTKPDKKMSKAAKLAIGATALAATVIAGIAIKNKSVAKKALQALEKRAKDLGVSPETLKALEAKKVKLEKCGKMNMSDVFAKIDDVAEKSSSNIDTVSLLSPKQMKEAYGLKNLPENSFGMVYKLSNNKYRISCLVHDGMEKSLAELVTPIWAKDSIYVIPIK